MQLQHNKFGAGEDCPRDKRLAVDLLPQLLLPDSWHWLANVLVTRDVTTTYTKSTGRRHILNITQGKNIHNFINVSRMCC
ncbi:hypothetical protein JTE90_013249 [Oedothorax gibbosus]|uniref:Uncharacterized protein n=1 Tax=Oedothorax gibbosus TaxID=931172 RepID=A0AAV6VE77_9ARAC|nr:hypothetical protein JTE90_013249 [Oedothorax gibbosus]